MTISTSQYLQQFAPDVYRCMLNVKEKSLRLHQYAVETGDLTNRLSELRRISDFSKDEDNWLVRMQFESSGSTRRSRESFRIVQLLFETFIEMQRLQTIGSNGVTLNDALKVYDASIYGLAEIFEEQPLMLVDLFNYLSSHSQSINSEHPATNRLREAFQQAMESVIGFDTAKQRERESDRILFDLDRKIRESSRLLVEGMPIQQEDLEKALRLQATSRTGSHIELRGMVAPVLEVPLLLLHFRAWVFCATVTALRTSRGDKLKEFSSVLQRMLVDFCNHESAQRLPETIHVLNSKASGLSDSSDPNTKRLAMDYARKARSLAPEWSNTNHTLARIIYDISFTRLYDPADLHDAKSYLESAIRYSPEYPKYAMTMSQVCLRLRDKRGAIEFADKALYLVQKLAGEDEDDKERLSLKIDDLYREINEWEFRNEMELSVQRGISEVGELRQHFDSGLEAVRRQSDKMREIAQDVDYMRQSLIRSESRLDEFKASLEERSNSSFEKFQENLRDFQERTIDKQDDVQKSLTTYVAQVMTVLGLLLSGLTYVSMSVNNNSSGKYQVISREIITVNGESVSVPSVIRNIDNQQGVLFLLSLGVLVVMCGTGWMIFRYGQRNLERPKANKKSL